MLVDHGFHVIGDDEIADDHFTDVDAVAEEGDVAVEAFKKRRSLVYFTIAGATSSHFPGLAAEMPTFGIRDPAVDDVGAAITAGADVDGFPLEAAGRDAADGAVFFEDVALATFDVGFEIFDVAGGHPIYGGFEEASVEVVGDGVVEGVDDVATAAEIGFEELGVVDVTGEAVVFPEDDTGSLAGFSVEVLDHVEEGFAPDDAGAGGGFVFVDMEEGVAVFDGPGADELFLLGDGEVLFVSPRVAEVGDDVGGRGEGGLVTVHLSNKLVISSQPRIICTIDARKAERATIPVATFTIMLSRQLSTVCELISPAQLSSEIGRKIVD